MGKRRAGKKEEIASGAVRLSNEARKASAPARAASRRGPPRPWAAPAQPGALAEVYRANSPQSRQLSRRLSLTGRLIGQSVYMLYGLNEEEIAIQPVEKKNNRDHRSEYQKPVLYKASYCLHNPFRPSSS